MELVTKASSTVCGSERRDSFIIAKIKHTKAVPSYDGMKDMINMFNLCKKLPLKCLNLNKDLLKGYLFFLNGSVGQYYGNVEVLTKEW